MAPTSHDDLIRQVEDQHARYLRNLHELNDTLGEHKSSERVTAEERNRDTPTPPIRPVQASPTFANELHSFPAGGYRQSRRLIIEGAERRPSGSRSFPVSVHSMEMDSSDEDDFETLSSSDVGQERVFHDERIWVQQPMGQYSLNEHDLVVYLKESDFQRATQVVLDDVYTKRADLDKVSIFQAFMNRHNQHYDSATYEVFKIGQDGTARPKHRDDDNDHSVNLNAKTVWDTIRHVNDDGRAVGRMTSLLDPTPLMMGALHLTMRDHFDMNELFQHLATSEGNKGKTKAYMNRVFEQTELRQRSSFFIFKYYTLLGEISGEKCTPAPWQQYDHRPADIRSPDHIDISECSSILALSLSGKPVKYTDRRKKKGKAESGKIYDTFAPWQLLNIQCFPHEEHVLRNEDSRKNFCNGPYEFLDCLAMEYRDAAKRNTVLNDLITKLITPPV